MLESKRTNQFDKLGLKKELIKANMAGNAIIMKNKRTRARSAQKSKQSDAVGQYASDAWSLAKRTAVGLNEIRKLINIETKFLDVNQVSTAINTTGGMIPISEIAQGLTSANRVGDSIRIQHIEIRGRVNANPAAGNSLTRVMVVRDLDGYGTAPAPSNVLEVTGSVGAPLSPEKYNQRERFAILYDELVVTNGTTQGMSSVPFTFMSAHSGHILYLGTTAAPASDGKGSLYVVAVSDEATNGTSLAFYSRITFTDD